MPKPLFLSALTILLLARAVFAGEPNTLTSEETAAGWKLLFDGKSTAGWVAIGKPAFPDKGWSVREGALHHEKGGGGGDIVTTESYGSFELQFEWRIGAIGNSGVKYNLIDPAKALGFEYQLIDEKHSDAIKGGALRQTASLYDLIAPTGGHKVSPVGEWNQSRLWSNG